MKASIITYIVCLLILAILLIGIFLSRRAKEKSNRAFVYLLFSAILFIILNIVCDALEGNASLNTLISVFNLVIYFAADVVIIAFNFYLSTLLGQSKERKAKWLNLVIYITCGLRIILTLVMYLTNSLFYVKDGLYYEYGFNFISYIASGVILVELVICVIINRKCFSTRQFITILLYEICSLIPVIIELYSNIYYLTGVGVTLSILMVYILIQETQISKDKETQIMLTMLSNTDMLTGLKNRRSYYDFLSEINPENRVGVLFCDLNGLKEINDHFGHIKGDEYIKKFGDILKSEIGYKNTFRISGDEFVVILPDVTKEEFDKVAKSFIKDVHTKRKYIASIGSAYGSAKVIDNIISEAEARMYEDKKDFREYLKKNHEID